MAAEGRSHTGGGKFPAGTECSPALEFRGAGRRLVAFKAPGDSDLEGENDSDLEGENDSRRLWSLDQGARQITTSTGFFPRMVLEKNSAFLEKNSAWQ